MFIYTLTANSPCSIVFTYKSCILEAGAMRSKILSLLTVAASLGFVQVASAADMPTKAPIVRAPMAVSFNWTGFYVGCKGGYGWGRATQHTLATQTRSIGLQLTITWRHRRPVLWLQLAAQDVRFRYLRVTLNWSGWSRERQRSHQCWTVPSGATLIDTSRQIGMARSVVEGLAWPMTSLARVHHRRLEPSENWQAQL